MSLQIPISTIALLYLYFDLKIGVYLGFFWGYFGVPVLTSTQDGNASKSNKPLNKPLKGSFWGWFGVFLFCNELRNKRLIMALITTIDYYKKAKYPEKN